MNAALIKAGNKRKASFKFSITTTAINETFTLPLIAGTHNFTVNWGDGTADSNIIAYDDINRIHTYAIIGTYVISMWGTCTGFAFNNIGNRTKVKQLLDFVDMGFTTLNFEGCSNLSTIASSMKKLKSLTTALKIFRNCNALVAIPAGIFDGSTEITSFQQTFQGATGLFAPANTFVIPSNLFKYNTKVTSFSQTFYGCTYLYGDIPVDLFRYNVLVTDMAYVFRQCTNLNAPPVDLFRYNTLVTTFLQTFNGCTNQSFQYLPTDLFRYNTLVTTFDNTFNNCAALLAIPTDLFRYNTLITSFAYTFRGCAYLQTIPVDLFRYNTIVNTFLGTFSGCTGALYHINIFYATGEEGTRFLDKTVNFTNCFYRTSYIQLENPGIAPDLWNCNFGSGVPTKTLCYAGAGNSLTSLTNYADIPSDWIS